MSCFVCRICCSRSLNHCNRGKVRPLLTIRDPRKVTRQRTPPCFDAAMAFRGLIFNANAIDGCRIIKWPRCLFGVGKEFSDLYAKRWLILFENPNVVASSFKYLLINRALPIAMWAGWPSTLQFESTHR
jgi:hypothetical protein